MIERLNYSKPTPSTDEIDPLVGHALHRDISARFRALQGGNTHAQPVSTNSKSGTPLDIPKLQNEDNDKTVEELLAELGPEEDWAISKGEEEQVTNLLEEAQDALKGSTDTDKNDAIPDAKPGAAGHEQRKQQEQTAGLPSIDLSVFQPEPDSEAEDTVETHRQSKSELNHSLDREAEEYLERIMDEISHENATSHQNEETDDPPPAYHEAESNIHHLPSSSTADLPSTPSKDPTLPPIPPSSPQNPSTSSNPDSDLLTTRYSSLSLALPSVPTTLPKPSPFPGPRPSDTGTTHTDAEVSTWCIICLDDATLQCIGCDGDLYCRNCWIEGHRGESAGPEERRHRAMEYNKDSKGKGKEAEQRQRGRKRMVGLGAT